MQVIAGAFLFLGLWGFLQAQERPQVYAKASCEAKVRFIDKATDQRVIAAMLKHGALEDKAGAVEDSRVVEGRTWKRTLSFYFTRATVREQQERLEAVKRELVGLEPSCQFKEYDRQSTSEGKRLAELKRETAALGSSLDDKPFLTALAKEEISRLEEKNSQVAMQVLISLVGQLPSVR